MLEQVRDDNGQVIGGIEYDGKHDYWIAESVHNWNAPKVIYDLDEARQWIREQHRHAVQRHPET